MPPRRGRGEEGHLVARGSGSRNTAVGNGKYDAYRDGSGTGNAWYRNTFGTKAGL